jgi:hypothetical protein
VGEDLPSASSVPASVWRRYVLCRLRHSHPALQLKLTLVVFKIEAKTRTKPSQVVEPVGDCESDG